MAQLKTRAPQPQKHFSLKMTSIGGLKVVKVSQKTSLDPYGLGWQSYTVSYDSIFVLGEKLLGWRTF